MASERVSMHSRLEASPRETGIPERSERAGGEAAESGGRGRIRRDDTLRVAGHDKKSAHIVDRGNEEASMARAAREWVSFDDPEEEGRQWQIDVTFLLSHWQCIFGHGCQGVLTEPAPELVHGCCSYG